ncbi:hypothetical protein SteCoe_14829 [Stentor coeruleus]|uniref:Cation efflux protein transmembrane domain-containing protein n=1 Tax=Stentor coeruleus TaxID=5963 RepID=A0A1R2C569_9CILI|nr:hypothetical protein SteCoe_14829 [Stentor coeruleus]
MKAFKIFRRVSELKDINKSMIKRELAADGIQNALKAAAFYFSGSQAVKAELMRASIDFLNHIVMLSANSRSLQKPDENYNYGYKKLKNMAVLLPGVCFGLSGIYNVISPIITFYSGLGIPELHFNTTSLSIILLSSIGEFYLYYKNLGDISNDNNLPFYRRWIDRSKLSYSIILKKKSIDPIQDAIVTENVLAITGVSMPILTSLACYATGLNWIDLVGEASNGIVQIYLGYLICRENIEILSGRSIDLENKRKIVNILKDREEVSDIADFKTEYIGDQSLKISAAVKYNSKEVANNIIEVFENDIKKITQDPLKQQEIRELLVKSTDLLFTHTTEIIKNMEEDVQKQFPNATEIDLELAKSNIKTEYEGVVSLTSSSDSDGDEATKVDNINK